MLTTYPQIFREQYTKYMQKKHDARHEESIQQIIVINIISLLENVKPTLSPRAN